MTFDEKTGRVNKWVQLKGSRLRKSPSKQLDRESFNYF